MPAKVMKLRGKWRVVEAKTRRLVRNRSGTPVDGGGTILKSKAERQARAINANQR